MTVLYDLDSALYQSVYKVTSDENYIKHPNTGRIRDWINNERSRDWMETEIVNLSFNRLTQINGNIFSEIEETGIEIDEILYFITYARNPIRKKLASGYKIKRKSNKWVGKLRRKLIELDFALYSDEWEADDLIHDKAMEIGDPHFIVLSTDKDLLQIPGLHFNYYRPRLLDENGDPLTDENGYRLPSPCKGLEVVTHKEAEYKVYYQCLTGDASDDIRGLFGVGAKKAAAMLEGAEDLREAAIRAFGDHYEWMVSKKGIDVAKENFDYLEPIKYFEKTYFLIKLGTDRELPEI